MRIVTAGRYSLLVWTAGSALARKALDKDQRVTRLVVGKGPMTLHITCAWFYLPAVPRVYIHRT